jgi:hypothetical protein
MNFNINIWDITKSVCLMAVVLFGIYFGYTWINKPSQGIDRPEMERIAENIVRKQIIESNKELSEAIKQLAESNSQALKIIKERGEDIKEVGKIVAKVKQRVDKMSEPSDHTYKKGSVFDHEFVKIFGKDTEGKEYPVAWAMYHPNQTEEKKWKTGTYPIELNLNVIETEQRDGLYDKYVEAWIENNQMKSTKGNQYPIEVTNVEWVRGEVKDKRFSFNPRLGFTGAISDADVFPGVDVSFFSYGRTHRDLDWRFAIVGVGYTKDTIYGYLFPVQYNTGNFLPLIENLYFGPFIAMDERADRSYGGGFSVLF